MEEEEYALLEKVVEMEELGRVEKMMEIGQVEVDRGVFHQVVGEVRVHFVPPEDVQAGGRDLDQPLLLKTYAPWGPPPV